MLHRGLNVFFRGLSLLLIMCCIVGCGTASKSEYITVDGQMLGTILHIVAETDVETSEIYSRMMSLDSVAKRSMSIFDENSLLSRINRGETDSLDSHIAYNIELARRVNIESDGVYDVTIRPLTSEPKFSRES